MTDRDKERFWKKVDVRSKDECWNWIAGGRSGYGLFKYSGRRKSAHRFSWEMYHNETIPYGKIIRHTCDNPLCVNPNHLLIGTRKDNARDMVERGRNYAPIGLKNGNCKLQEEDVLEIRRLRESGLIFSKIAVMFGISPSQVHLICKRKSWKHI